MSAQLELDIVELLDRHPHVGKAEFINACTKIATCKWPATGTPRRPNRYQLFVKANMKRVIDDFPTYDHKARMNVIGQMWKQQKIEMGS